MHAGKKLAEKAHVANNIRSEGAGGAVSVGP